MGAAQVSDCRFLLSEDLQEEQIFGQLKVSRKACALS